MAWRIPVGRNYTIKEDCRLSKEYQSMNKHKLIGVMDSQAGGSARCHMPGCSGAFPTEHF